MCQKKVLFSGMLMGFCTSALFATSPTVTWRNVYGGSEDDVGSSIQETSDGGFIIVGTTYSFGGGNADVWLLKIDENGDTLWTKTYGDWGDDYGSWVLETPEGGYIITGWSNSYGVGLEDVLLIRTDDSGDVLWTKTYAWDGWIPGYNREGRDWGSCIQLTADGGFVVVGYTCSPDTSSIPQRVYLLKLDSKGDTTWTTTFDSESYARGSVVRQTSDGGYIISGTIYNDHGSIKNQAFLLETDSEGYRRWLRTYGETSACDWGCSVCQTPDGGYLSLALLMDNSTSLEGYLIKTGPDGKSEWINQFVPGIIWAYSIEGTSHATYFITGCTRTNPTEVFAMEVDVNGDTLWSGTYGTGGSNSGCETTDGGYILAGGTEYLGEDLLVVKLSASPGVAEEISPDRVSVETSINRLSYDLTGDARITLYSADGSKILSGTLVGQGVWKAPEGLEDGVYFMRIEAGNNEKTKKLILLD